MDDCWWRPFRDTGDYLVIHVDLTPHAAPSAVARSWLDQSEQQRWHSYRLARPRREFALCRAALRATLCRQLGCRNEELTFAATHHGKPFAVIHGTRVATSFNVSHSGNHGLIAVAPEGRIGVDVEERGTRHDPDGPIRAAFPPAEQAELAMAPAARRVDLFLMLWTMKEALIKALGMGLALDTSGFEIPPAIRRGSRTGVFRFPHDPAVSWRLDNLGTATFAAAVAHELDPVPV